MSGPKHSYFDGAEWVLRTRVEKHVEGRVTLTHDAEIHATNETRSKWNAHFWSLFPGAADAFRALAARGEVNVKVMFRFKPSVRMKQKYGGMPVLKVARTAETWHGNLDRLPKPLALAVDEYDRDKRMLDSQRRQAWVELIHFRLPAPPAGYRWELTSGDPRFYGDLLNFGLRSRAEGDG